MVQKIRLAAHQALPWCAVFYSTTDMGWPRTPVRPFGAFGRVTPHFTIARDKFLHGHNAKLHMADEQTLVPSTRLYSPPYVFY